MNVHKQCLVYFAGPILLFELCDLGRLKSWLAGQKKVTDEVEDKMITFSVHIARGMAYLHSKQVNSCTGFCLVLIELLTCCVLI